jgi:hypothetical protein
MYEAVVYVGGRIGDLGNDAVVQEPASEDLTFLRETVAAHGLDADRDWKKIVAGRKLWNFDKSEALWREAL